MEVITSRSNPGFKTLVAAKKDPNLILLEGRRLVEDALSRGIRPRMAALTPGYVEDYGRPGFSYILISDRLFGLLADTVTPQGILAGIDKPLASLEDMYESEEMIILDGIQDPGNVGTIIRTAEAFGIGVVVVTQETASPFSGKAIRASMGSCLGVKITRASPDELKKLPHKIISLVPQGEIPLDSRLFEGKCAICLGQEGSGVSKEMLKISHKRVHIPMKGPTESLNVAVAAGIVMACLRGIMGKEGVCHFE
ncbi:MAG: RNA methyltransferase [Deltaproteobacteria bacterium]|nr:RNA methyltransferase [Deltaproteobacteria bacterium]